MVQNIFPVFLVRTLGISQFLIQGVNIRREGTQTVIRCGNRRVGKSELPSRNAVYQCWLILCELMGAGDFKRDIPVIESVVVIGVSADPANRQGPFLHTFPCKSYCCFPFEANNILIFSSWFPPFPVFWK